MAGNSIHTQKISIRDLSTSSVILYPTRAQVVRVINGIVLVSGANEIIIDGLTPTVDEHSIKVDGKGSATITDLVVDRLPNREHWDDVYPSESEDDGLDDEQSDENQDSEKSKILSKEMEAKEASIKQIKEQQASASARLTILENSAKSVEKECPDSIGIFLDVYQAQRQKAFEAYHTTDQKEWKVANKQKKQQQEKKERAAAEKSKAKRQLREERSRFWPKKVYRVVISLDATCDLTPASSRRGSVQSLEKGSCESVSSTSCQISLSISYITSAASWAPRYDLSLNTLTSSGTIIYRAELYNATSETWKDSKVTLSTSQTLFKGLGEAIPCLEPWHICLNRAKYGSTSTNEALLSAYEKNYKRNGHGLLDSKSAEPRDDLFGYGTDVVDANALSSKARWMQVQHARIPTGAVHLEPQKFGVSAFGSVQNPRPQGGSLFGSTNAQPQVGGLFGSIKAQPQSVNPSGSSNAQSPGNLESNSAFGAPASQPRRQLASKAAYRPVPTGNDDNDHDVTEEDEADVPDDSEDGNSPNVETIIPDLPDLATQKSSWSESGFTTTYDVPGLRTIAPSFTARRHKIASIQIRDLHLSHILVPKLRAAAFLKARLRNTSSITLLKGPTGLTLDGSFLGNATLPRCSPDESFSVSLGVDFGVNVTYSTPVVHRSQSGVFQKEDSGIYTRSCTITNTKADRAIEGLMLDQIPVSEEERLRVDVLQPMGLRAEGDSREAGNTIGMRDESWGSATATMKKGGEVSWDFKIEPGKNTKFVLEYEARFPSGELVIGV